MKKKNIILSLVFLLLLVCGITVYYFINKSPDRDNSSGTFSGSPAIVPDSQSTGTGLEGLVYIEDPRDFDGTIPIIKKMKETFSIVGTRARGQGNGPPNPTELLVAWYGELEFTVNDAQCFSTIGQSGIDKSELANPSTNLTDRPFVTVDVTIQFKGTKDSLFSTDIFRLSAKEDYELSNFYNQEHDDLRAYLEYFSLHGKGDDYFAFNLPVNQPMNFEIGFFVPKNTNKDELFLDLGGTIDNLIGVQLDLSDETPFPRK